VLLRIAMYSETMQNVTVIVVGINEITKDSALTTEVWALFWKCLVTKICQCLSETTLTGATFIQVCLYSRSSEIV
jgi:hypothetical protein